jgi:hypothetical protein
MLVRLGIDVTGRHGHKVKITAFPKSIPDAVAAKTTCVTFTFKKGRVG